MPTSLELRWEFSPEDLFEEPLSFRVAECPVVIDAGVIIATLPSVAGDSRPKLREAVERSVESSILGAQLAARTSARITRPSLSSINEDGSRGHIIECEPGAFQFQGCRADACYTRSDGTVADTRRERIARKHRLSTAAALHGSCDEALARMLRSYRSALADKEDELIHLYEVLDTLASRFGTQTAALRQLSQPKRKWSRLGQLCNELPLREGRHRGRIGASLRSASVEELTEARTLASELIEVYIEYLQARSDG